jgi:hypothetical protein
MVSRPTYDDANLILRLYDMRREERMRKARAWFTANFKVKTWEELQKLAPGGSDENASYRMVVTYWDMVGSFITSGVLNKELFFESGRELLLVWERMRDVLPLASSTRIRSSGATSRRSATIMRRCSVHETPRRTRPF